MFANPTVTMAVMKNVLNTNFPFFTAGQTFSYLLSVYVFALGTVYQSTIMRAPEKPIFITPFSNLSASLTVCTGPNLTR